MPAVVRTTDDVEAVEAICKRRGLYDRVFPLERHYDKDEWLVVCAEGLIPADEIRSTIIDVREG
ncbi:hypothetical protein [Streptomyces sp. cg36]|uniref:hypothetical protein n=1 Tax=Streptomyces sp. cg36 TaxID=3238798 RepID=UPI0034E1F0B7